MFKKKTKALGFPLDAKTNDLPSIIFTNDAAAKLKVTLNSLYLDVPSFTAGEEKQMILNGCINKSFDLCFDVWPTIRQPLEKRQSFNKMLYHHGR